MAGVQYVLVNLGGGTLLFDAGVNREIERVLRWFGAVQHVEIGFNYLSNPTKMISFPASMETLILESNAITLISLLDSLNAPKYRLCSRWINGIVFENYPS
jgi:hypothetical protein